MTPVIGLIRGVNVGGHKMLKMADLKAVCESLGFASVKTYLQSGNVVFGSRKADRRAMAREIEEGVRKAAGMEVKVILRTAAELSAAIAKNPMPAAAESDPSHLLIMFLAGEMTPEAKTALRNAAVGPEEVHVGDREIYIHYPHGIAGSKLERVLTEKKLGVGGTARNWNTVNALLRLAEPIGEG